MKKGEIIIVRIYPPYSFYTYLHYNPKREKFSNVARVIGWSRKGTNHPYISISLASTGRIMRIHPAQVQYEGIRI